MCDGLHLDNALAYMVVGLVCFKKQTIKKMIFCWHRNVLVMRLSKRGLMAHLLYSVLFFPVKDCWAQR